MATSDQNKQMAKRMKDEGRTAPKKWHGVGADVSAAASRTGISWTGRYSSAFERGMLGGALAEKSKGVDVLTDERVINDKPKDYSRQRIIIDDNTNKDLLAVFIAQYDKMDEKTKKSAPSVTTR